MDTEDSSLPPKGRKKSLEPQGSWRRQPIIRRKKTLDNSDKTAFGRHSLVIKSDSNSKTTTETDKAKKTEHRRSKSTAALPYSSKTVN